MGQHNGSQWENITDIEIRKHEGKAYVGVFQFQEPAIMVRDPELLRAILVKDFASFQKNVFPVDKDLDPLVAKNPFVLTGEE
ncbi:Probable cytochrome P450 308a1 [Gryllus bimaculatus]|nr:Probable cytochrome P450 308a1 [Gryllus bimaculatus]